MDRLRYLELLDVDGRLLSTAAADDLRADVPACPGWTVGDVVRHTAEVYEHKIACIQLAGARPDPWPPRWPADRDPVTWFVEAHGDRGPPPYSAKGVLAPANAPHPVK